MFKAVLNPNLEKILQQPYPFDAVDANKKKAIEKLGKDFIVDFGVGDPTDATPELIREACKKAVDERKSSGYPTTQGHEQFKASVANFMKQRFNVSLSNEEIVATYGAKYASFRMPQLFLEPGKQQIVFMPNPGYPPYTDGTLLAGGVPYYLNLLEENNFLPDLEKIDSKTRKNAKLFFLNSPHSPTAQVYPKEKLKEIVDFCNDNAIILASDECYSELYYEEAPKSILEINGAEECSIVLNSLSKRSMMTGYAVGFFASKNPDLCRPFDKISRKSIQGVATFIQDAATVAFNDSRHCGEMRKIYKGRKEAFLPSLEKIGCEVVKPKGTFFVWAKIPSKFKSALDFSEWLLFEKGINCVPGNIVSKDFLGKNPGNGFARFALVPSIEKVKIAAERLSK